MVCHTPRYGKPHLEISYATPENFVCQTSKFVMPHFKIWYATPQNLVCHTSKFGMPHLKIWYATPQNVVCHTSKFCMPHLKIWLATPQNLVCRIPRYGKLPIKIWYATPQNLVCRTSKFACHSSYLVWPLPLSHNGMLEATRRNSKRNSHQCCPGVLRGTQHLPLGIFFHIPPYCWGYFWVYSRKRERLGANVWLILVLLS